MNTYTEIDLLHEYLLDKMKSPKIWNVEYMMETGAWGKTRGMYYSKTSAYDDARNMSWERPQRVIHEKQVVAHFWRGVEVTIIK